jgi:hypothetical protein
MVDFTQLVSAGLGVLDYGIQKDQASYQKYLNNLARQDQRYYFDQTMDKSIQRRAADARAAGISPLAAMGSAPASMPSIQLGRTSNGSPMDGLFDALQIMIQSNAQADLLDKEIELMKLRDKQRNQRTGYAPIGQPLEFQAQQLPPVYTASDASVPVLKDNQVALLSDQASQSMESFWSGLVTIGATTWGHAKRHTREFKEWLRKEFKKAPPKWAVTPEKVERWIEQKTKEYSLDPYFD